MLQSLDDITPNNSSTWQSATIHPIPHYDNNSTEPPHLLFDKYLFLLLSSSSAFSTRTPHAVRMTLPPLAGYLRGLRVTPHLTTLLCIYPSYMHFSGIYRVPADSCPNSLPCHFRVTWSAFRSTALSGCAVASLFPRPNLRPTLLAAARTQAVLRTSGVLWVVLERGCSATTRGLQHLSPSYPPPPPAKDQARAKL